MAGQAVAFQINMVSSNGSYVLSGQSVLFPIGMVSVYGSYTLNGQVVNFLAPFQGTPILLHAYFFDATLRAPQLAKRSVALVFGTVSLADEQGNQLVDEQGNILVATVDNWQSYLLHALPDDFTLTAE